MFYPFLVIKASQSLDSFGCQNLNFTFSKIPFLTRKKEITVHSITSVAFTLSVLSQPN